MTGHRTVPAATAFAKRPRVRTGVRAALALAAALASSSAFAAWESDVNENGLRKAWGSGTVSFAGAETPATLRLVCRPGEGGAVSWELEIRNASALKDFGFDDYEGPDAAGLQQRRTEIEPEGGMMKTLVKAAPGGWYTEADVFVLGVSALANEASDVALLADVVGPQTKAIVWRTPSLRGAGDSLVGRFDTDGAMPALRKTMMGCGPAPAFDAKRYDALLGRNPASSGLWNDRALQWRLQATLGRDYDAFESRMSQAQPLAKDGTTYYVLSSPTDDGNAAALLFDEKALDVVFVDDGKARRLGSQESAIQAPEAVRAFVGKASGAR